MGEMMGSVGAACVLIPILLIVSKCIRRVVRIFDALYLPTAIIAGTLGLILGPQVLGRVFSEGSLLAQGVFPEAVFEVWAQMPKLLISVVFAGLFIGKPMPGLRAVWQMGGPQVLMGFTISFGQYAIGLAAVLFVLMPLFEINPLTGVLLEISLSGGHGTAAGLAPTFAELGFEEGQDLALGLATIGLIAGVVLGTAFVNYAVRSDRITLVRKQQTEGDEGFELSAIQENEDPEHKKPPTTTADPLSLHLGLVATAIALGYLLLKSLQFLEQHTWGAYTGELVTYVPLFPMAMIGGAILQALLGTTGLQQYVSRDLVNRISGTALDFIIVSAMATLSLASIGRNWQPFAILAALGLAWTVFCFWVLAPRMIPDRWFEKGIGDFGQGMGMAVSGLLLMRIADPENKSRALESFGYKQLPYEPFLGGGLLTALALPLCARLGPGVLLVVTAVGCVASVTVGMVLFRKDRN